MFTSSLNKTYSIKFLNTFLVRSSFFNSLLPNTNKEEKNLIDITFKSSFNRLSLVVLRGANSTTLKPSLRAVLSIAFRRTAGFTIERKVQNSTFSYPEITSCSILKKTFTSSISKRILLKLKNSLNKLDQEKLYFSKYYYIGLGYKLFTFNDLLFAWLGFTHYSLVPINHNITIFPKKRRIYLVGNSKLDFTNFYSIIRRIKRRDIYKGKGLLEVKSYKNFIRMKTGKKKQ